jgi:small subunit ribosomal protein S1
MVKGNEEGAAKEMDERTSGTGKDTIDMDEMAALYEESFARIQEGGIVTGIVVGIEEDRVLVDIGYKSEGYVSLNQFPNRGASLKIGDKIEVLLESTEDTEGQIVLSKEKADKIKIWDKLTRVAKNDEIIEGTVTARIKGGLSVDIGLRAFLPGSQIDLHPIRDMDELIGKKFEMKIIKLDKARGSIVLSRRVLLEKEREKAREKILKVLKEGEILGGIVKNITEYGVFIDLGGIDGLLHITDMSWGRVSHPSELFVLGDKVKVMVLKFDKEKQQVSLGLKQITPDPWSDIETKYPVDSKVKGKVVSITDYGAFIELEKGIEGLVHVSEMSWDKRLRHASKIVAIGDTVEAIVLSLNKNERKISLGMKQTEPNPWTVVEDKYPKGTVTYGKVRNVTDFGVFVNLDEGIEGLIHVSDLSWSQKTKNPAQMFKKGQRIKIVVLNVDKENERLSLGVKQLTEDPWKGVGDKYKVGSEARAKIVKLTNFGAFAELEDGIEGLIHITELGEGKIDDPKDVVNIGDEVNVKVIKIDQEARKIALSLKQQ